MSLSNVDARDADTDRSKIEFICVQIPRNGRLEIRGFVAKNGDKFNLRDIEGGSVR